MRILGMKMTALFMGLLCMTTVQAKTQKAKLFVDGKCEHCKERIQKAALSVKGVSAAVWNQKTKQLLLKYNDKKTDTLAIEKVLAGVGHDTKSVKADDKVYEALPPCCHYRK